MKKKKAEVCEDITLRKGVETTEGFIRKFEKQVDFYELFQNIHYELQKGVSYMHCRFCHSNTKSLKIDLGRKTFSCSVCGLKGGLVLFLMLRDKAPLRAALRFIAENTYGVDVSVIPHHTLIP